MKILLVDDDPQIVELIKARLKQDNYTVDSIANGLQAIDLLQFSSYSLVLLDVVLPQLSGIEVCQTLRLKGDKTPILMLTGQDHTQDKIMGLDAGADDYLVKPFELDELAARVRALIRRNSQDVTSVILSCGPLQFDPCSQCMSCFGKMLALRPKELAILELMMRYPNRIFSAERLLDQLWTLDEYPSKSTVKSHIRSLRKHLKDAGLKNVIETFYSRGYRLNADTLATYTDAPERLEPQNASPTTALDDGSVLSADVSTEAVRQSSTAPPTVSTGVGTSAALSSSGLSSNKEVIAEAWDAVQALSWNRLSRLEILASKHWPEAMAIAHQLKGTLGSYGFKDASRQARHVEQLLSNLIDQGKGDIEALLTEIRTLRALVEPYLTDSFEDTTVGSPAVGSGQPPPVLRHVLIVAHDEEWARGIQVVPSDKPLNLTDGLLVQTCSPLDMNDYLIQQTPSIIVLECAIATQESDLGLIVALHSNYGDTVPIITVVECDDPKTQRIALTNGTAAIALKRWSIDTLWSILQEYIIP